MAKRFLLPLLAAIIIVAMVVPGCGEPDPVDPVDPIEVWEPIEIDFIIRQDLYVPMFPAAGEYFGDLFDEAGFLVNRLRLTGPEAFAIWIPDDPMLGTYSAYTGGWGITSIPRDYASNFYARDTKFLRPWPRWLVLDPPAEYLEAAEALYNREYATLAEREALFTTAAYEGMKFSGQILLADVAGTLPFTVNVNLMHDTCYGIGWAWPQTIHYHDEWVPEVGGDMIGEQYFMLSEPWNPVDGSGASADLNIFRTALQESGMMPDGRDGHYWPWRIESAVVTTKTGLPIAAPIDWDGDLVHNTENTITAPDTAWVDWDAENQVFITVGQKMDPGSDYYDPDFDNTAARKSVVTYPSDIFDVPMHDGTTLSPADFVMSIIMGFDHGDPESDIYDEAQAGPLAAFLANHRGVEITSLDPLTIESYNNLWSLDADWNVATWFPSYGLYGQFAPWHLISIGWLGEAAGDISWGTEKADEAGVVWMDYTKGPSLDILEGYLETATTDDFIPYYDTIAAFYADYDGEASAELDAEIAARYAALDAWFTEKGHFWVSTSPLYLESVEPVAKIVELRRFEAHPDDADRWFFLMEDHEGFDQGRVVPVEPIPARTGAWVDSITIRAGTAGAAVDQLKTDGIQVWFMLGILDPGLSTTIEVHPNIQGREGFGSFAEIMFNVAGDEDGRFVNGMPNPFYHPKIREAFQWMVDRDFIVGEILGGRGSAIYAFAGSNFPEYDRYGALFDAIAVMYRQDKPKALDIITTEMEALGFELRAIGANEYWHYQVS